MYCAIGWSIAVDWYRGFTNPKHPFSLNFRMIGTRIKSDSRQPNAAIGGKESPQNYTPKTPQNMSMLRRRSSTHRRVWSPKTMRTRRGSKSFVTSSSVGGPNRPVHTRDHGAKFGNPPRYPRARCMARVPHNVSTDTRHTSMCLWHHSLAWTTWLPTKLASGTRYESWLIALFRGVCGGGVLAGPMRAARTDALSVRHMGVYCMHA